MNPYSRVVSYSLNEMNDNIIEDFAHEVLLGPQAEIVTMCENIYNDRPYDGLGFKPEVTKTFRWKPGTYDKVKTYWTYLLGWKKANNMRLFFNRMGSNDNMSYYRNRFTRGMKELDKKMFDLRSNGVIWQDNTENVINLWNNMCDHISTQDNIPHIVVPYDRNDNILFNKIQMELIFNYSSIDLHVWNNSAEMLGITPMDACHVSVQINFLKLINGLLTLRPETRFNVTQDMNCPVRHDYNGTFYNIGAIYEGDIYPIYNRHPYIGSGGIGSGFIDAQAFDPNSRNLNDNTRYKNICLGDLEGAETIKILLNLDINNIDNYISKWLSNYIIGHTNPLNGIRQWFHGMPKWWTEQSEDFQRLVSTPDSPNDCRMSGDIRDAASDGRDGIEDMIQHCRDIECELRDECFSYQEHGAEDIIEIKRQLVAEMCNIWATDLDKLNSTLTFDDLFDAHDARWFEMNKTIPELKKYLERELAYEADLGYCSRITLFEENFKLKYSVADKQVCLDRISEVEYSDHLNDIGNIISNPNFFCKPYKTLQEECEELEEELAFLALEEIKQDRALLNGDTEATENIPEEEMFHRLRAMYGNNAVNIGRNQGSNIHGSELPAVASPPSPTDQDLVDHEARDGVTLGEVLSARRYSISRDRYDPDRHDPPENPEGAGCQEWEVVDDNEHITDRDAEAAQDALERFLQNRISERHITEEENQEDRHEEMRETPF